MASVACLSALLSRRPENAQSLARTYLPAIHIPRGADRGYMRVCGEHFVQDGAVVLALYVLVVFQGDNILERQRFACHWVFVELLNIWQDIGQVVDGPV